MQRGSSLLMNSSSRPWRDVAFIRRLYRSLATRHFSFLPLPKRFRGGWLNAQRRGATQQPLCGLGGDGWIRTNILPITNRVLCDLGTFDGSMVFQFSYVSKLLRSPGINRGFFVFICVIVVILGRTNIPNTSAFMNDPLVTCA